MSIQRRANFKRQDLRNRSVSQWYSTLLLALPAVVTLVLFMVLVTGSVAVAGTRTATLPPASQQSIEHKYLNPRAQVLTNELVHDERKPGMQSEQGAGTRQCHERSVQTASWGNGGSDPGS